MPSLADNLLQFFTKLGELFASRKGKDHGAVYLTQKRRTAFSLSHPNCLCLLVHPYDGV